MTSSKKQSRPSKKQRSGSSKRRINGRVKGFDFEREVVHRFGRTQTMSARRMWGSDGRNAGYISEVDLVIKGSNIPLTRRRQKQELTAQCKRVMRLPKIFGELIQGVDLLVTRENSGMTMVVIRLEDLIDLLDGGSDAS